MEQPRAAERGERQEPSTSPEADRLYAACCQLDAPAEAEAFLADLLSPKEIAEFARRLEVARLLSEGRSYLEVSRITGASSTTVSRVSKCLNGHRGGYRLVLERLGNS